MHDPLEARNDREDENLLALLGCSVQAVGHDANPEEVGGQADEEEPQGLPIQCGLLEHPFLAFWPRTQSLSVPIESHADLFHGRMLDQEEFPFLQ